MTHAREPGEPPSDLLRLEVEILDSMPDEAPPEGSAAEEGLVLLVADDDMEIRRYVRRCALSFGLGIQRVLEAGDGRDALERLRREPVDLLVCDVRMPVMSGFELCAAVRADPELRGLPVLLVTGQMSASEASRRAREVGADAVLSKPFNALRLCHQMERLLRSRSPPDRSGPSPASTRDGEETEPSG